jgi:hypothetical protein
MRHIHAELLHALAEDADLKVECYSNQSEKWHLLEEPRSGFNSDIQYRIHDPYRPFKEAFAEGKTVQLLCYGGVWKDRNNGDFGCPPDHYRIKPRPVVSIIKSSVWNTDMSHEMFVRCTWHDDELVKVEVVK